MLRVLNRQSVMRCLYVSYARNLKSSQNTRRSRSQSGIGFYSGRRRAPAV